MDIIIHGGHTSLYLYDTMTGETRHLQILAHWRPVNGGKAFILCGALEPGAVGQRLADLLAHQASSPPKYPTDMNRARRKVL